MGMDDLHGKLHDRVRRILGFHAVLILRGVAGSGKEPHATRRFESAAVRVMLKEMGGHYRPIEHTADLAIEVDADSLEELFRLAAEGMFDLIRGDRGGRSVPGGRAEWRTISATGPDLEALLVAWLGELLYVHSSEGLVMHGIRRLTLAPDHVDAEVGFTSPDPEAGVEREIKGVTYHDLRVERREGRWRARIVFDV